MSHSRRQSVFSTRSTDASAIRPPARRKSVSERLVPSQEGIDVPASPPANPPPSRHEQPGGPSDAASTASRPASPTPDMAIEPPARSTSLMSRARRQSVFSRRSTELPSDLRPPARRKSISEKFIPSQEGINVPSPDRAPTPPSEELQPDSSEATTAASRPVSPSPSEAIEPPQARVRSYHPLAPETLILLMPGSVFGVLARLGLSALNTYDGEGVFPLAWVQAVGCLIMGLCVGYRDQITAFHPPLYTAIATGFCGSLTTFSGWMLDVFLAFSNGYAYNRIWIYDIMDGLTRTFVTFAVSLCGLALGLHFASYNIPHSRLMHYFGKNRIPRSMRILLVSSSFVIYILTIPMYFVVSPQYRPTATAALLFSFPGTVLRHVLGTQLNTRTPYIPSGTLLANVLGTALLAIFHSIQRLPPSGYPTTVTSCNVLQGLIDGFCGCLSTVSTFAVEVRGMQGRGREAWRAWVYAVGSWVIGQVLCVAIVGGSMWGGGAREDQWCVTKFQ